MLNNPRVLVKAGDMKQIPWSERRIRGTLRAIPKNSTWNLPPSPPVRLQEPSLLGSEQIEHEEAFVLYACKKISRSFSHGVRVFRVVKQWINEPFEHIKSQSRSGSWKLTMAGFLLLLRMPWSTVTKSCLRSEARSSCGYGLFLWTVKTSSNGKIIKQRGLRQLNDHIRRLSMSSKKIW